MNPSPSPISLRIVQPPPSRSRRTSTHVVGPRQRQLESDLTRVRFSRRCLENRAIGAHAESSRRRLENVRVGQIETSHLPEVAPTKSPPQPRRQITAESLDQLLAVLGSALAALLFLDDPTSNRQYVAVIAELTERAARCRASVIVSTICVSALS